MTLQAAQKTLRQYADPAKKKLLQRFFKTGPGEYAEGDIFLGVVVPQTRTVAKQFRDLPLNDTTALLRSHIHEERLLALFILTLQYKKGTPQTRNSIYKIYLKNTRHINNWDLIDLSAGQIVGAHLFERSRDILDTLARSQSLWERRIAMLATFYFIRNGQFYDTLKIAEILLEDGHDLIHKAVGWMLREIGKIDLPAEEEFLKPRYKKMPRTMLRYAIEKFPEKKRQAYLKGRI